MPFLSRFAVSTLVTAFAAQPSGQQPSGLDATRVLVSRREVRVLFPAETSHRWGWSRRNAGENSASYAWIVSIDGIDGPRSLALNLWQTNDGARTFASLNDVVAAGRAQLCSPGMVQQCHDVGMRASVEGARVVLTLRDSATIAQLFSMRPATVNIYRGRPGASDRPGNVRAEYIAPQIPVPDSAFRADVARRRRQYQASVNTIRRSIGAGTEFRESTILIETGDSAVLTVNEMHCSFDACGGFSIGVPDSTWVLDDTTLASIRRPGPISSGGMLVYSSVGPYLVARRPGTTTIRARDIHSSADTMPSRDAVPSSLQRELRVLPRLARIEIVPRPDTVQAGTTVEFRTRVIDREGQEVAGLLTEWRTQTKPYTQSGLQASRSVRFDSTGTASVVARVGGRSDSLTIVVVPRRR